MYHRDSLLHQRSQLSFLALSHTSTASRYTGLEILVWSIDAHGAGGLTWRQLDAVIQGLQQAMYNNRNYKEAQFMIYDGLTAKAEQGTGELYSVEGPPESAVKEA